MNRTFALSVQQSVQSYSDVTVLLALHGAGPIFALLDDWARILFSDESRFHLDSSGGRSRVYRRVGERYQDNCFVERRLFGWGSIMVWGGITGNARAPLVAINGNLTGARYHDEILQAHVFPWPAVSPDLSPIEHAWDEMERRLRQLPNQLVTLAELSRALVRIWNGILQTFFTNRVGSMRRRCNACITAMADTPDIDFVTWCLRRF